MNEPEKLAKPLVDYLRNNHNPHTAIYIDKKFSNFEPPPDECMTIGEHCVIKSDTIKLPPGTKITFESL